MSSQQELCVIGTLLTHPKGFDLCSNLSRSHFENDNLGELYDTMHWLQSNGLPVDAVSIAERMNRPDWLSAAISRAQEHVSTRAAIEHHANGVIEQAVRRQIRSALIKISERVKTDNDIESVITFANETLSEAMQGVDTGDPERLGNVLSEVMSAIETGKTDELIPTGIKAIDEMTGGIAKNLCTIIAGRPAMGKSCMGVNLVANLGKQGYKCLMVSLEDTSHHSGMRMLSRKTGISSTDIIQNRLDAGLYPSMNEAIREMDKYNVWLDDKPGRTVNTIRHMAIRLKRRHGLDCLFVDHLGELTNDGDAYASTSANIRALRDIAKDLKIAVVVLGQLKRANVHQADKRPTLTDLRDSGRIEEVARSIWFLHRPNYYDETADENDLQLIIAKSTHGKCGSVSLYVDLNTMTVGS
jgi:replicative DNA helicase